MAGDYRGARTAYSEALLAEEPAVEGKAHEGMGNTLFQLGWMGLSGSRYPEGEGVPDMAAFDDLVRRQLERMGEAEVPETGETNEFIRFDSIILNWTDAVRHYRSAMSKDPSAAGARRNEEITMAYLKRLKELLEEEKQQTEAEMPQPGEGQGEPQPGQGEPQEGDGGQEPQEGKGGEEKKEEGEGKGKEEKDKGKGGEKEEEAEPKEGKGDEQEDPNESPEQRAKRILSENADLEKGPLSQGRRDFRPPDKDW